MDEIRKTWLSGLKAEDEICIESHGISGTFHEIAKIDKVTPTKQFRVGQYLYNSDGERRVGWSHYSITPLTYKIKQGIRNRSIRYKVKQTDFDTLPHDKISRIYDIIMEK